MKKLYFATLSACNQHCLFCARGGDEPAIGFISIEKAKEILVSKRSQGYEQVVFDGGEPTLRNDLVELIDFAKRSGYSEAILLTNGILLSDEGLVKSITSLEAFGKFNIHISVSLHSHKKNISEKLTNACGTFDRTIQGIKNILRQGHRNVSIYHIISEYNYRDLISFVDFVNGVFPLLKNITFSFIYPSGAALKNVDILPKFSEVFPILDKALQVCRKNGIRFSLATCSYVPICFLERYEYLLFEQQELNHPERVDLLFDPSQDGGFKPATPAFHKKTKVKIPGCRGCVYDDKCGGIWRVYADKYGTKELKPVRDKSPVKFRRLLLVTGFSCNNNCVFCSNVAKRENSTTTKMLKLEMKRAFSQGYKSIEFIGGEPLIRKDFLKLVTYARGLGYWDIGVTTNGRLFSYANFTKQAVEAGLSRATLSLYGHEKKIHDALTRTPGSFDQCVKGLENALRYGLRVSVNTVINKLNYSFIGQMAVFLSRMGVKEWHLLALLPDGRALRVYDNFFVPFTDIKLQLNRNKSVLDIFELLEFFDFPLCLFSVEMLHNKRYLFMTPQRRYEFIYENGPDVHPDRVHKIISDSGVLFEDKYMIKPGICQKCRYSSKCCGLPKPYYAAYGDSEVKMLLKRHDKRTSIRK